MVNNESSEKPTVRCQECGTIIVEPLNLVEAERKPCPSCGSKSRKLEIEIREKIKLDIHDKVKTKGRHKPTEKPFIEEQIGDDFYKKEGKWVHKSVLIDRDNDKYKELIVDKKTNKVIHKCEEPLSRHTGHGTAKYKKINKNYKGQR